MSLAAGTRLGPYEIVSTLGAGGMGEVYKARDTRLDRSVAIKVLPSELAADPERRARFEREARAVAALDHPHICGIHDVGDVDGTHFLVMPLVDGQTLAARLEKGPLPLDQALKVGGEIADALDKAHRQGIVHRDLKPANIMLTKVGAKLLDFGLAKLQAPTGPISLSGMTRLAMTPPTAQGTILGTVHYMAPEQVEGKEADARSDIWALGAVLYETVTAVRPFAGDTPASIIGAILKDTPAAPSSRQPLAPRALDHLVAGCLAKDPEERWQSAADVRRELRWMEAVGSEAHAPAVQRRAWSYGGWIAAVFLLVAWGAFTVRARFADLPPPAAAEPLVFSVYPPVGHAFVGASASVPVPQIAVSPDGRHLAFVAAEPQGKPMLWLRRLSAPDARRLIGTEDAEQPFWSPDSTALAFFSQGLLKRLDINGNLPPQLIGHASVDTRGGAWSVTGDVLYTPSGNQGLHQIASTGGAGRLLDLNDRGRPLPSARWPAFFPDGRRFVFQVRYEDPEQKGLYLGSLDGSAARRLIDSDFGGTFASGHMVWLTGTTLLAQPFDMDAGQLTGTAARVAEPVAASSTGYPAFSVSTTGVLAYSSGLVRPSELRWIDRSGRAGDTVAPPGDYVDLRLSPDGARLAFSRTSVPTQSADVWVKDLARGTESRITNDPLTEAAPLWSPGGDFIVFRSNRAAANLELYRTMASPGGVHERIYGREQQAEAHGLAPSNVLSTDLSADGRFVIYHVTGGKGDYDLWAVPLAGDRRPVPLADGPHNEVHGNVSPDGRWLAYVSDESGRYEVYIQGFPKPETAPRTPVSVGGGLQPRWSPRGNELFYLRSDGMLMSVAVRTNDGLELGATRPLFMTELPTTMTAYRSDYVPAPDGTRFLMKLPVPGSAPPSITVIVNWLALLPR